MIPLTYPELKNKVSGTLFFRRITVPQIVLGIYYAAFGAIEPG